MVNHDARVVGQVMLPFAISEIGPRRLRASSRASSLHLSNPVLAMRGCRTCGKRNTEVEVFSVPFQ